MAKNSDRRKTAKVPRKRKGYIDHTVTIKTTPSSAGLQGLPPSKVEPAPAPLVDYAALVLDSGYNPTDALTEHDGNNFTHVESFSVLRSTGELRNAHNHRANLTSSEGKDWHGHLEVFRFPHPLDAESMKSVVASSMEDLGILVAAYETEWNGTLHKARDSAELASAAEAARDRIEQRLADTEEAAQDYQIVVAEAEAEKIQGRVDRGEVGLWTGEIGPDGELSAVDQVKLQLRDFADEYDEAAYTQIAGRWKENLDSQVKDNLYREDAVQGYLIEDSEAFEQDKTDALTEAIQEFDAAR